MLSDPSYQVAIQNLFLGFSSKRFFTQNFILKKTLKTVGIDETRKMQNHIPCYFLS